MKHFLIGSVLSNLLRLMAAGYSDPNPLIQACLDGNLNRVVVLVDQGADTNALAKEGGYPPLIAARNNAEIIRYLLAHGAKLNGVDVSGDTALHTSAYWHYPDAVSVLLEAGANPNLCNKDDRTPLMNASFKGYDDIVKMLLEHHADVNVNNDAGSPLFRAAENNHLSTVKLLVAAGANIKLKPAPIAPDRRWWSLMTLAARDECIEEVDFLLDHGLDINEQAPDGQTGLIHATYINAPRMVEHLIKRGANVDLVNENGVSALMAAFGWNRVNLAESILKAHPKTNLVDSKGRTLLMLALSYSKQPAWDRVFGLGVDLNAQDKDGRTALIRECYVDYPCAALFLLEHNADVNVVDKDGNTALSYAGNGGRMKLVEALKAHGAKNTAVHILPKQKSDPPLSDAKERALAVAATYFLQEQSNFHLLGGADLTELKEQREDLKEDWDIMDTASAQSVLEALRTQGHRARFQKEGAMLAAIDDNAFKVLTTVVWMPGAEESRNSFKKWQKRSGLAWDWVRYINLVNLCYSASRAAEGPNDSHLLFGAGGQLLLHALAAGFVALRHF